VTSRYLPRMCCNVLRNLTSQLIVEPWQQWKQEPEHQHDNFRYSRLSAEYIPDPKVHTFKPWVVIRLDELPTVFGPKIDPFYIGRSRSTPVPADTTSVLLCSYDTTWALGKHLPRRYNVWNAVHTTRATRYDHVRLASVLRQGNCIHWLAEAL
jgi:hypothetical protein